MLDKPIIGITMGDPASIGPEIAVKALLSENIYTICKPILIGDAAVFTDIITRLGLKASVNIIKSVKEAEFHFGQIDVFDLHNVDMDKLLFGRSISDGRKCSF